MPKYLIERTFPNAGTLSPEQLQDVARKSNDVLRSEVGNGYHWIESFVTGDRIFCVHVAPDEETVREHARCGGFPIDRVMEVKAVIDASTGEGVPAR